MSENEENPDPEESVSDGVTTGADARLWITNDILALILIGTYPLVILINATGWVDLSRVPGDVLTAYIAFAGIATIWAFGSKAARLWFERKSEDG